MQKSAVERPKNPWEEDAYKKKYPFEYLKYEVDRKEKIATVTLTNPAGTDTAPAWFCFPGISLIRRWERDDDVKVVIIKSAGKNFCTGLDLGEHLETALKEQAEGGRVHLANRELVFMARDLFRFYAKLLGSAKPTIAQVHGKCSNAGLTLQRVCDMTVASNDAEFGEDFERASGNLTAGWRNMMNPGGHNPFGRLSYEMEVLGRTFSAKEMTELGAINRVVPREKLDKEVLKEAKKIASYSIPELMRYKLDYSRGQIHSGALVPNKSGIAMITIRHEPGEFSFFRILRQQSVSEATRARKAIYGPLGGFGRDAEVERVVLK